MKDKAKNDLEIPQATFEEFGLEDLVLRGAIEAGFKVPSPIQLKAIPVILQGRDVVGQAHTGTGKTAAFGLPAIHFASQYGRVQTVVITPTRELAVQVSDEICRLGQFKKIRSVPVYGGQPYPRQIESIRRGAQVVVATPGRFLDLLEGGRLKEYIKPAVVVLDEADEMLDMGFLDDVKKILELLPPERQTLLFSATMPKPIQDLASRTLKDPVFIRIDQQDATSKNIQQQYYVIDEHERDDAAVRLMDSLEPGKLIIFCRTKREVDRLSGMLTLRGELAQGLHGDMEQATRERVISAFRKGDFSTLIATDVAARGLDVPDVTHVLNYHLPFDAMSYVHRIGRTGRAGKKGVAITLVTPHEYHGLRRIQHTVGKIENRLVPGHHELKKAQVDKTLEAVRNQPISQEAEMVAAALEDEMGLAQAVAKLVSLVLKEDGISGPDKIGLQGARLDRLQKPPPARQDARRPGGKPFQGKPYQGKGGSRPPFRPGKGGPAGGPKGKVFGQKPPGKKR